MDGVLKIPLRALGNMSRITPAASLQGGLDRVAVAEETALGDLADLVEIMGDDADKAEAAGVYIAGQPV